MPSIFTRIIQGEIPCYKIAEDADNFAFLDINPVVKGHTLVIPREHHDPITETPPALLNKLLSVVQKIVRAQFDGLGADGVNVSQANGAAAGQVVPHIHFHVIPRFSDDGHHWNWRQLEYEGPDEMAGYADSIVSALGALSESAPPV